MKRPKLIPTKKKPNFDDNNSIKLFGITINKYTILFFVQYLAFILMVIGFFVFLGVWYSKQP